VSQEAIRVIRDLGLAEEPGSLGVRLDSGDLMELAKEARHMLDEAALHSVRIFASGGLDELDIDHLVRGGAPIDAFGVGTRLGVSADAPYLDMVYKLVRFEGRDILKLSEGKESWVGGKQIVRTRGDDGRFAGDILALADEPVPAGADPLLQPVMAAGELLRPHPTLDEVRARCAAQLGSLPEELRRLRGHGSYRVDYSAELRARQASARAAVGP